MSARSSRWVCLWAAIALGGCIEFSEKPEPKADKQEQAQRPQPALTPTEPPPKELLAPVALWREGAPHGQVDARGPSAGEYVFMDLGEGWSPVLFTDGAGANGEPFTHNYRATYLALARGEFPDDVHGERARNDKYLELYGIMPTLSVLRQRLKWASELECVQTLDLSALTSFKGVVAYEGPSESVRTRERYLVSRKWVERLMTAQQVSLPEQINLEPLKEPERQQVRYYLREHDDFEAIKAAQARLVCEGYYKGKGKWVLGAFDWPTHEALAEFERRHRVYSWGAIGPDTLEALRMDTVMVEHETVIRVLVERAMHAFGAIEDGSAVLPDGSPVQYKNSAGQMVAVPNLEEEVRKAVVEAFGLKDPASTRAFLEGLELEKDGHLYVAIPGPRRPEYHSGDMELSVEVDRGDVWYDFPYDEQGNEKPQPVSRRPHLTVLVTYNEQTFPIARFGSTIGGWRSELIDENVWWKYKGSPPGPVLWEEVVSAPVWLPPLTTPPRDLLKRRVKKKPDDPKYEVNYHETGPSYASAYGLVAAYHRPYAKREDGTVRITGDEGIRTHGSVDYMSIMRRHSHGCHRLHNHIAVRLFSFVINHRPHHREGHQPTNWVYNFVYEDLPYSVQIKQGGYVFKLERPIFVNVLEGRIRGRVAAPVEVAIPRFNADCKAYYMPDGTTVIPHADGTMEPSAPPDCDAGVPFAPGVDLTTLAAGTTPDPNLAPAPVEGAPGPEPGASLIPPTPLPSATAVP